MRYKSIELINYAGIYNGMGLNHITIDFTRCMSNKIVIRGSNGSGKSTIINSIHPMPDGNDRFIPGVEARKNIVLVDGMVEYSIRYIHPVTMSGRGTTKGYISKSINGQMVELNPNGNISSCKEIIFDEFGFDSAFISLTLLSSEDRGLVDRKPVERKKLINSITNSLDTFNAIYKTISKRSTLLKGLMNNITSKIDSIGNEAKLQARLQAVDAQRAQLEEDRDRGIEAITALKMKIADMEAILEEHKYSEISSELISVSRLVKSTEDSIQKSLQEFNIPSMENLQDFLLYISQQIITLEASIDSLRAQIPSLITQRESEYKELCRKDAKLKSLQNDHSYNDTKRLYNEYLSKVKEEEEILSSMGISNTLITKDEFDTAMSSLKRLLDGVQILLSSYDLSDISYDISHRHECISMISNLPRMRESLSSFLQEQSRLNAEYQVYSTKREIAKELENRPVECNIDTCPYISSALQANIQYPEEGYIALGKRLEELSSSISELRSDISRAENMQAVRANISLLERELEMNIRFILKLPVRRDFMESFFSRVLDLDLFDDITNLYQYIDCGNIIEQHKVDLEQLRIYESEYRVYQSKTDIIDSMMEDIAALRQRSDSLSSRIDEIRDAIQSKQVEINEYESSKSKLNTLLTKYKDIYLPNVAKQQELSTIKSTLDKNAAEVQHFRSLLETQSTNIGETNADIRKLNESHERLVHALEMLAEYRTDYAKYQAEYTIVEKIKYYASPNTGIQSMYIGMYMNKILSMANQLLGMLFGGEFVLQPFVVNDSEFRIPCIGSMMAHDDISSMSTAQKSIISTIISFAILQQSSTKYNIISLDELDSGLDNANRSGFINLLDSLMNLLHCEQAFVISHNSELDTSACDIIELKNTSNELVNGNIIWKF